MAKKTKTLTQWCIENKRNDILSELNLENNFLIDTSDRIEYNSPIILSWICNKGHKYSCEVVGRTLFGLKCPSCNPDGTTLPIGTKYGCLTIIDSFNAYQTEVAEPKIQELQKEKEDFLKGIRKPFSNIDSADYFDHRIEDYQKRKYYKCQCKCGKIHYLNQNTFLQSRRQFCTERITEKSLKNSNLTKEILPYPYWENDFREKYCGLAVQKWIDKQKTYFANGEMRLADNYDADLTGYLFESLEIVECVNDNYKEIYSHSDLRKKDAYIYIVDKLYKCRCYLCGKEHIVKSSQFHISPPSQYGAKAYSGYWSEAKCDCHEISSFQWIVNKLLIENNIPYRVEYSFSDLLGYYGTNMLKFDFAILNKDGSIKCLIECQGEQHYMPIDEFGGNRQYHAQVRNDQLKKEYIQKHNIELIEISYKDKKIEKIESILRNHKII